MDIDLDTGEMTCRLIRIYETSFYNNYIANQIDFTFLNNSPTRFTTAVRRILQSRSKPAYQVRDTIDLFEDYRLTAGVQVRRRLRQQRIPAQR
jgi:hypothetical protein